MKVLLVNGSPHKNGCTYTALNEVAGALNQEGIHTDVFHIGTKPLSGCTACGKCAELKKCVFDDSVNEFLGIAGDYDGYIFGSPVHFAAACGAITSFVDRAFRTGGQLADFPFYLKPAAAVVSARRAGTTATLDQMNKYFTIAMMPIISSRYWNMVHGSTAEEVKQDLEGLQTMRFLGRNMAFFLKCKEAGIKAGVPYPKMEPMIYTNFIR